MRLQVVLRDSRAVGLVRAAAITCMMLALVAVAGCADNTATHTGEFVLDRDAGFAYELHVRLARGAQVAVEWSAAPADGVVSFDVHRHDGDAVVQRVDSRGSSLRASFSADATGDYFLYWHSPSVQPITISFAVQGPMDVVGSHQG